MKKKGLIIKLLWRVAILSSAMAGLGSESNNESAGHKQKIFPKGENTARMLVLYLRVAEYCVRAEVELVRTKTRNLGTTQLD